MSTAYIHYLPEGLGPVAAPYGAVWAVAAEGTRPSLAVRRSAMLTDADAFAGFIRCAGCAVLCATETGTAIDGFAVAVAQADRAVNDLPDFTVADADGRPVRVAYAVATVLPVCPEHNGSPRARESVRDALTLAAVGRLIRHAERVA